MSLADDLTAEVSKIFHTDWQLREGQKVPEAEQVGLGNDAVTLDATVLYADLAESTAMVDSLKANVAAEVYKAYLHCAAKIIRDNAGAITAYDGDRIMAVYIGDSKNSNAITALKINYAVQKIVDVKLHERYTFSAPFSVRQAVGIDSSQLFVARTGIRGANDLVWVGRAANYAAKLCGLRQGVYASWITEAVYSRLNKDAKFSKDGRVKWERHPSLQHGRVVYRSNWRRPP